MKFLKIGIIIIILAAGVIQLFPPEQNISSASSGNEMANAFVVPADVQSILKRSCYDCHSNNTVYPWYAHVQPVGWFLNNHIQGGKRHLNFDEFTEYTLTKQYRRLKDIAEQIEEKEMPLTSYLLIHRYAVLTADEKAAIINWTAAMQDSMKVHYPNDSLDRPEPSPKPSWNP